jgi:predicted nicotinamide N-methyase
VTTEAARRVFIAAQTTVAVAPLVPELRLHLATEITPMWQATEAHLRETGVDPPFWAFAWAGGQAVARYVLDHPDIVRDRIVLDFAAGGGLLGLAAARAGARGVTCVEVDPLAVAAIGMNAALNGLADTVAARCEDVTAAPVDGAPSWQVILAGDVCYEQPMAERVLAFLRRQAAAGALVLLGDPGRAYVPCTGVDPLAVYDVPTTLELEDRDIRRTTVWRLSAAA